MGGALTWPEGRSPARTWKGGDRMDPWIMTDPRTGAKVASTRLARGAANLIEAPVAGIGLAGICALATAPVVMLCWRFQLQVALEAVLWLLGGVLVGGTLIFGYNGYRRGVSWVADGLHDAIAHRQLRRQLGTPPPDCQVPETALSLAPLGMPPVPGDTALSRSTQPSEQGASEN